MLRQTQTFRIALVAFIVILLDFATKKLAHIYLLPQASESFIPGILNLTLTSNTGAAFSVGQHNGMLMTGIAFVITMSLIYWTFAVNRHFNSSFEIFGLAFLIGGACGNLMERLARGKVTDFLDFAFISFPVFNLADVCIDIGIALIIIARIRSSRSTKPSNQSS
jgi:signal peptidase II